MQQTVESSRNRTNIVESMRVEGVVGIFVGGGGGGDGSGGAVHESDALWARACSHTTRHPRVANPATPASVQSLPACSTEAARIHHATIVISRKTDRETIDPLVVTYSSLLSVR